MGVKIEVIFGEEPKDATQELVEDLIFIITSFAGNGMRSHKKTLLVQGVKKLIGELSGEDRKLRVEVGNKTYQKLKEVEKSIKKILEDAIIYGLVNKTTSFTKIKSGVYKTEREKHKRLTLTLHLHRL